MCHNFSRFWSSRPAPRFCLSKPATMPISTTTTCSSHREVILTLRYLAPCEFYAANSPYCDLSKILQGMISEGNEVLSCRKKKSQSPIITLIKTRDEMGTHHIAGTHLIQGRQYRGPLVSTGGPQGPTGGPWTIRSLVSIWGPQRSTGSPLWSAGCPLEVPWIPLEKSIVK